MCSILHIVTGVREEKAGLRITVDDEKVFWLSRSDAPDHPLQPGMPIDLPAFQAWLSTRQYPKALDHALGLLAARARSTQEVREKLEHRKYMEQTIQQVLRKLEKERLLDDEAFAQSWAAARSRRQFGRNRILMELRQKGISNDAAHRACANLDKDETEKAAVELACKLLKKRQSEADPRKTLQKVMAAMARRGFSYESAGSAVKAALEKLREEN